MFFLTENIRGNSLTHTHAPLQRYAPLQMGIEMSFLHKGHATLRARKGPLARVRAHVVLEVVGLDEALLADGARKRALVGVDALVL